MFDLALLIFFCVMAYRTPRAIYRETEIFREFGQPRAVALLFPLGPALLLAADMACWPHVVEISLAGACYIPALFLLRRVWLAFETAGTDRVINTRAAISGAFATGLASLVYAAVHMLLASSVAAIK